MTSKVTAGVVILQTISNIQMHIKHDIPFKKTEKEPKGIINSSDIIEVCSFERLQKKAIRGSCDQMKLSAYLACAASTNTIA